MASILRQIVAGPRARHDETGLDLCYVTSDIIATSGPSQTYPQLAYRNPLDKLVAFLDDQHGDGWAIWEFRAEGTGYPDEAVYGRIRHYPWPDHHPPPFRLVPMIMASMRNWLAGGELSGTAPAGETNLEPPPPTAPEVDPNGDKKAADQDMDKVKGKEAIQDREAAAEAESATSQQKEGGQDGVKGGSKGDRVVVVHCKAGKGRSGSMACSFLISERGWKAEDALARFTARRMRPKFGSGVSIPSQLRYVSYVDRWANVGKKKYVERAFEIVEVHMWGLRSGVKVCVEGFVDEGRKIKVLHTFSRDERLIVEGDTPDAGGVTKVLDVSKLAAASATEGVVADEETDYQDVKSPGVDGSGPLHRSKSRDRVKDLVRKVSRRASRSPGGRRSGKSTPEPSPVKASHTAASASSLPARSSTPQPLLGVPAAATSGASPLPSPSPSAVSTSEKEKEKEPGGMAVIFKPRVPLIVSHSDVNISVERRNRAPASMGLTMVTAVAHVWFNIFFEGRGPEQDGKPDDSGVFEIEWEKMDGIKGSSQKGTRALDRLAVVWRAVPDPCPLSPGQEVPDGPQGDAGASQDGPVIPSIVRRGTTEVLEPAEGGDVPQMQAADWRGGNQEDPEADKRLGLRVEDRDSGDMSEASSIKSQQDDDAMSHAAASGGREEKRGRRGSHASNVSEDSFRGVKASGPDGEALVNNDSSSSKVKEEADGNKKEKSWDHGGKDLADVTAQKGFIVE